MTTRDLAIRQSPCEVVDRAVDVAWPNRVPVTGCDAFSATYQVVYRSWVDEGVSWQLERDDVLHELRQLRAEVRARRRAVAHDAFVDRRLRELTQQIPAARPFRSSGLDLLL